MYLVVRNSGVLEVKFLPWTAAAPMGPRKRIDAMVQAPVAQSPPRPAMSSPAQDLPQQARDAPPDHARRHAPRTRPARPRARGRRVKELFALDAPAARAVDPSASIRVVTSCQVS